MGRDSAIADVKDGAAWMQLAQSPKQWAKYANRALLRYKNFRIRMAKVCRSHKDVIDVLQRTGCVALRNRVYAGTFPCLVCERTFDAPQGWFLHANARHGFVSESSEAAQGNTCFCCAKRYKTTERLRHHLRYSEACRSFFREHSDALPETDQHFSKHPQYPWTYTEDTPIAPPAPQGRDRAAFSAALDESLHGFVQPDNGDCFISDLFLHLQNTCKRAIPFGILIETFQDWLETLSIGGDDRIIQAGLQVLDWIDGICRPGEREQGETSDDILGSEGERRMIQCWRGSQLPCE